MNPKTLLVKSKKEAFTEILGNNLSKKKGEGYDFRSLREYEIGDDTRKIDWVISAKSGTMYVKEFDEERELSVVIAPVLGGSVYFGSTRSKQELIAQISAILGYGTTQNGDRLSSLGFNNRVIFKTNPTKNTKAVEPIVGSILHYDALRQTTDYKALAKTLYMQTKRKSLIVVIGDFVDEVDFSLLARKHEVILIVVRDSFEESPRNIGIAGFIDPSTLAQTSGLLGESEAERYSQAIRQNDEALLRHCKQNKIRMTKIYTHQEPIVALRKLFG